MNENSDRAVKFNIIMANTKLVNGCMEWLGSFRTKPNKINYGYPAIYYKGKTWKGNRLVMFLLHGNIPEGMWCLHTCDNMKCINPTHLYFGTPKQNIKDAYDRKRARPCKVTHCPKGHEYAGKNLRVDKRGYRSCLTCAIEQQRVRRKKQTEIKEK